MADAVKRASEFARELADAYGDGLRSVVLYGSFPRHEDIPGISDVNLMVLVDSITMEGLEKLSPLFKRWVDDGNSVPLLMAWDEAIRSADVFAIEIADMHDHHGVLHGEDPVPSLPVKRSALRHQIESELRARFIQLREALLLTARDPKAVGALLLSSISSFNAYLRGVLRLGGREVPRKTEEMIDAAAQLVGGDPSAFLKIWRARSEKRGGEYAVDDATVDGYYRLVEKTIGYVDRLEEKKR